MTGPILSADTPLSSNALLNLARSPAAIPVLTDKSASCPPRSAAPLIPAAKVEAVKAPAMAAPAAVNAPPILPEIDFFIFELVSEATIPARRIALENCEASAEMTVFSSARADAMLTNPQESAIYQPRLAFLAFVRHHSRMDKKALIGLLIRHGLTIAGGIATGSGYLSESELQAGTGAVVALVGIILSVLEKRKR